MESDTHIWGVADNVPEEAHHATGENSSPPDGRVSGDAGDNPARQRRRWRHRHIHAVEQVFVETLEQAQALACLGNPTVQVEGRDCEPEVRARQDFGLT
jgi:hypothetical protein